MNGVLGGLLNSAADGVMRDIWTGTLALLRNVLGLVGKLGQIDPTPGAGRPISGQMWSSMLTLAGVIAGILFFAQLALAVLNPRRHMLHAALGPLQYLIAMMLTTTMVVGLLGAADELTTTILAQGANVTNAAAAMDRLGLTDNQNAVKALVLGVLGIIGVLPLAIGYGIMLLFRSASILVLIAALPIVTAGLVNLSTKHWFWRSVRWLLALIFVKPTFALCFAIGSGVVSNAGATSGPNLAPGMTPSAPEQGTGMVTLLLGLGIMFVALFAPMALFRLLAFVEPGTQPHQTMMSAFGSAMAGFKQAGSGIAQADIGSVFAGATGGRFGGGDGSGGSDSGGDAKKAALLTAATAAATGGASAAAGGAAAGQAGSAAGSSAAGSSAAGSSSGAGVLSGVGSGNGTMPLSAAGGESPQDGESEDEDGELAGAGAAAPAARSGAGGAGGAGAAGTSGGASPAAASGGSTGGPRGASGTSGGSSGGPPSGSLAGHWAASGAMAAASSQSAPRLSAAGSALGSIAGGAWQAAQPIAGATPMPPSPHGGTIGHHRDPAAVDYAGGLPPRTPPNAYRDPSWERPAEGDYAEFGPGPDDRADDRADDEPDDDRWPRTAGLI